MFALFYDTETTWLTNNGALDSETQPHIVQLAARIVDLETRQTTQSIDLIVIPHKWSVSDRAADVHGITTERAMSIGSLSEFELIKLFLSLSIKCPTRIAHNQAFDEKIINIGIERFKEGLRGSFVQHFQNEQKAECTAKMATPILKLPPTKRMLAAGRDNHKTPNLGECHYHFTGKEIVDAHNAMADVRACIATYFGCIDAQKS